MSEEKKVADEVVTEAAHSAPTAVHSVPPVAHSAPVAKEEPAEKKDPGNKGTAVFEAIHSTLERLAGMFNDKIKLDDLQRALMTEQKNRILQLESMDFLKGQKPLVMALLEIYGYVQSEMETNIAESGSKTYASLEGVKNICEVALENNSYSIVEPTGRFDPANMMCSRVFDTDRADYDGNICRVKKCGLVYENHGTRSVVRVPQVDIYKLVKK